MCNWLQCYRPSLTKVRWWGSLHLVHNIFFTITCSLGGEMKVIAIHKSMIFFGNVSRSKLESLQVIEDSWKRVGNTVISAHRYQRYIWLTLNSTCAIPDCWRRDVCDSFSSHRRKNVNRDFLTSLTVQSTLFFNARQNKFIVSHKALCLRADG